MIEGQSEIEGVMVDFALQYNANYKEEVLTFANNIRTREGGTHLAGFKTALTRAINAYIEKADIPKKFKQKLTGDDVREGLTAVVSVKSPSPSSKARTKTKLGNSEWPHRGQRPCSSPSTCTSRKSKDAKAIVERPWTRPGPGSGAQGQGTRAAQGALSDHSLPGKLADCQAKIPRNPNSTSLRVIRPVARPNRGAIRASRHFAAARQDPQCPSAPARTRCSATRKIRNLITAMGPHAVHGR